MSKKFHALLLDDDPWFGEALSARLQHALDVDVTYRTDADCSGTFDVYIVDNRFGAGSVAAALVREIRDQDQDALVVVLSGTLSRTELLELIRAKCDLAYEKGSPKDLDHAIDEIGRSLKQRQPATSNRKGFGATVRALGDLVYQLNRIAVTGKAQAPR